LHLPDRDRFIFGAPILSTVKDGEAEIRKLIVQGKEIRSRSLQLKEASRDISGKVTAGVGILNGLFDLSGYRRTTKSIGKWWLHSNVAQQKETLILDYEGWYEECRNTIGNVSVSRKGLTARGNSRILQSRFSRTRRFARIETRLRHGLAFLEGLLEQDLIRNEDVSEYLNALRRQARARENALSSVKALKRAETILQFPGAKNIEGMLRSYPEEGEAIRGAISTYENKGPDANRQALASCRNALENLIRKLSKEGDWKKGLSRLTRSDTKRRYIKDTYRYLSAYGSHGPRPPTDVDTELGIEMTIAAMKWLLMQRLGPNDT
jgi:hypothetical protein